jgi:hypothetical protein
MHQSTEITQLFRVRNDFIDRLKLFGETHYCDHPDCDSEYKLGLAIAKLKIDQSEQSLVVCLNDYFNIVCYCYLEKHFYKPDEILEQFELSFEFNLNDYPTVDYNGFYEPVVAVVSDHYSSVKYNYLNF